MPPALLVGEQDGKTISSTRIVPIPQVLLKLGFVEWIQNLSQASSPLFPEILTADPKNPAQMIIGHVSDTTICKHYNEANLATPKSLLDRTSRRGNVVLHRHYRPSGPNLLGLADRDRHQLSVVAVAEHSDRADVALLVEARGRTRDQRAIGDHRQAVPRHRNAYDHSIAMAPHAGAQPLLASSDLALAA